MDGSWKPLLGIAVAAAWLSGCPEASNGDPDGGEVGDVVDAADVPEPPVPEPPAPPVLTPCPAGWSEATDDAAGATRCEPWPPGGPGDCGPDEAHFPGEPGCERVGSECPPEAWAGDLPDDGTVLFVRTDAAGGGSGTRAAPFATIAEALAVVASGQTIALAPGTYDEVVPLPGGVTLLGACTAETVVASSTPNDTVGTIAPAGAGVVVRNLTVSGRRIGISVIGRMTSVHLEDVIVADAENVGWRVTNQSTATARNVVVRDTRGDPSGEWGRGAYVASGGSLEIERGVLERNRDVQLAVFDAGTSVRLADVAVRDGLGETSSRAGGDGISVQDGATLEASRLALESNTANGLIAFDPGTTVIVADAVIRGTRSQESDLYFGHGVHVEDGARVELSRAWVADNREIGAGALDPDATLVLTDVAIVDTESRGNDLRSGLGAVAAVGARLEATRVVVARAAAGGVYVGGTGATARLDDVVVRDGRSQERDGMFGRGLAVEMGAGVEARRLRVAANRDVGVFVLGAGSSVTLEDAVVDGTRPAACATDSCAGIGGGSGLVAVDQAALAATRFAATGNALCGVQVAREAGVDLFRGEVSGNAVGANGQVPDYDFGRLTDEVLYRDNERNLDSEDLPVPETGSPLG